MNWDVVIDFVLQQGIWCALFVWLFFSSRKEAKERETTLYAVVKEQGEKLKDIAETLEKITDRVEKIEDLLE